MGYLVLLYGILILVGGVIGYLKADSLPSLMMGGLFGVLLIASAYGITRNREVGRFAALGLTLLLTFFFGYRFVTSWAPVPGALMGVSLAMLITLLLKKT